jgi:hypothetical protein
MKLCDYPHHDRQATIMSVNVGDKYVECKSLKAISKEEYIAQTYELPDKIEEKNGRVTVPVSLFSDAMYSYVTIEGRNVQIERSGHIISMSLEDKIDGAESPYCKADVIYVPFEYVISQMDVDFERNPVTNEYEVIVETRFNGPRKLTPAEEKLPYAKYYNNYWNTPYIKRIDTLTWAKKCALYAPTNPQDHSKMLHIKDVNRLLDREYRENEWTEGFTLFDDGTGVMCAKTEMPGVTKEAFLWWFAWHVEEDIRYMLWCPPSHYGISPSLELRQKLRNPNMTLFDKTHGGDVCHFVYEPISIDALSYEAAAPAPSIKIRFFDPEYRGFTPENRKRIENERFTAVCGNDEMLHFFVENDEGTGGTLYSHFWCGMHKSADGSWVGSQNGMNEALYGFLMTIAQHANKEFSLLADILPQLYNEFKNDFKVG